MQYSWKSMVYIVRKRTSINRPCRVFFSRDDKVTVDSMESVRKAVYSVLWKSNVVVQQTLCGKCPVF